MTQFLITVGGVRAGRIQAGDQVEAVALFVQGRDIPADIATVRAYTVTHVPTRRPRA